MTRVVDKILTIIGDTGIVQHVFNSSQGWFACVKMDYNGEILGLPFNIISKKIGRFDDK